MNYIDDFNERDDNCCARCAAWQPFQNHKWGNCSHYGIDMSFHYTYSCDKWSDYLSLEHYVYSCGKWSAYL
jgi:hypothetical protein